MEHSEILCETMIDNQPVRIVKNPLSSIDGSRPFIGQKINHPFAMKHVDGVETWWDRKKNKQVTKKTKELAYDNRFISEEADNDVRDADRIELKHDGQCGYIKYENGNLIPFTRYDVKRDESGKFKNPPPNSFPCEPEPQTDDATHWPHMVPLSNDPKAYKHNLSAFDIASKSGKLSKIKCSFTCEYMGLKFNHRSTDPFQLDGVIVPHGLITLEIPKELRTHDGMMKIMQAFPFIEGMVIYGKQNVWKIRRDMFYCDSKKLQWPTSEVRALSSQVALV